MEFTITESIKQVITMSNTLFSIIDEDNTKYNKEEKMIKLKSFFDKYSPHIIRFENELQVGLTDDSISILKVLNNYIYQTFIEYYHRKNDEDFLTYIHDETYSLYDKIDLDNLKNFSVEELMCIGFVIPLDIENKSIIPVHIPIMYRRILPDDVLFNTVDGVTKDKHSQKLMCVNNYIMYCVMLKNN